MDHQSNFMGSCCCSVIKVCPTHCDPLDCSTPGPSAFHYLRVCSDSSLFTWWCYLTISSSVTLFFRLQSFPASGCFPMNWLFASGGQNIGASASASVLPMNIQGWFPLGLTGLISFMERKALKSTQMVRSILSLGSKRSGHGHSPFCLCDMFLDFKSLFFIYKLGIIKLSHDAFINIKGNKANKSNW